MIDQTTTEPSDGPNRASRSFPRRAAELLGGWVVGWLGCWVAGLLGGWVVGWLGCWAQAGKRYVGYWMGKEHWGKGIATKMLSIFLQHLEERPLYAQFVKHNVASIRVLEKSGFALLAQEITSPNILLDENEELVYVLERPAQKDSYSVPTPE